jgi:hypothetical protein
LDVPLKANVKSFNPNFNAKAPVFKPFVPTAQKTVMPAKAAPTVAASGFNGLDSLNINNDFTPSTPYVHKFRTEICKNFELYGKCKYGDEVSTKFHSFPKNPTFGSTQFKNKRYVRKLLD